MTEEEYLKTFGFITDRCEHCNAHLSVGIVEKHRPICLNGCNLPAWQYKKLLNPGQAIREIKTEESKG